MDPDTANTGRAIFTFESLPHTSDSSEPHHPTSELVESIVAGQPSTEPGTTIFEPVGEPEPDLENSTPAVPESDSSSEYSSDSESSSSSDCNSVDAEECRNTCFCGATAKYRCPACRRVSCSATCVKAHKERTGCTGKVDITAPVAREDLLTAQSLDRDYNFLQTMKRAITVAMEDVQAPAPAPLDPSTLQTGKRERFLGPKPARVDPKRPQSWERNIGRVTVKRLPPHAARARQNRSGFDKTSKTFMWTVELCAKNAQPRFARVSEATKISELGLEAPIAVRTSDGMLKSVDATKSLAEALAGTAVLEFPTLYETEVSIDPLPMQVPESEHTQQTGEESSVPAKVDFQFTTAVSGIQETSDVMSEDPKRF